MLVLLAIVLLPGTALAQSESAEVLPIKAYPTTDVAFPVPALYPSTGYPATTPKPITPIQAETITPPAPEPSEQAATVLSEPTPTPTASEVVAAIDVASDVDATETIEIEPEVHWWYPTYWFGPAPWDSGFELGLNGSSGTSESLSFRTGGFVKRETDDHKFDGSLYYNKNQADGIEVQSNALLSARYDWLLDDSPWTLFVLSQAFYDEFQAFDFNLNANTGVGYRWIDQEWGKFTTSVGTGVSREFGALVGDEWIAEASFGFSFEQQVGENKKFYAKMDYFPEWTDFGNYRILSDIGMEIELVQPSNISLKFSVTDRFDSNPGGVEPHNLNYSVLLIWKL